MPKTTAFRGSEFCNPRRVFYGRPGFRSRENRQAFRGCASGFIPSPAFRPLGNGCAAPPIPAALNQTFFSKHPFVFQPHFNPPAACLVRCGIQLFKHKARTAVSRIQGQSLIKRQNGAAVFLLLALDDGDFIIYFRLQFFIDSVIFKNLSVQGERLYAPARTVIQKRKIKPCAFARFYIFIVHRSG